MSLVTALALFACSALCPVRAADGDLDTTFSFDGKVTTCFPADCTFVSATGPVSFAPAPGANGTVIWSSSSLANGGRLSVTMTVKVSTKGKGSVTDIASISSSSFDPVLANNTATVTTRLPAQGK